MFNNANEVVDVLISRGYDASVTEVNKNNGVVKVGVCIRNKGSNVGTNVYINEDDDTETIIQRCIKAVQETPNIGEDFFDWENVKNALHLSLVNYEINKDSGVCIKRIPETDLGIIVKFLAIDIEGNGKGYVTIRKNHLERFGITEEELFEIANEAFQKSDNFNIFNLGNFCSQFLPFIVSDSPLTVVSSNDLINGAIMMIHEKVQNELSKAYNGNFYIIPSSIHEFIALPYNEHYKDIMIESGMIADINSEEVSPEERLSDNLFYFDAETKSIKTA